MTPITIACSLRALFNLEDANAIFLAEGPAAFNAYVRKTADRAWRPGPAMGLIQKLAYLNTLRPGSLRLVILSRASPAVLDRLVHSLEVHGITSTDGRIPTECGMVLCSGADRFAFSVAMKTDLFLSNHGPDVRTAIEQGLAAATITADASVSYPSYSSADLAEMYKRGQPTTLAFDGDAVLFDGTADAIYRQQGMAAFTAHVHSNRSAPMSDGPLANLFRKLHLLKDSFPKELPAPYRLALVTARGVSACHQVDATFAAWGIEPDTWIAAAGADKGPILRALHADILFDDTPKNVTSAENHSILGAHVPYGEGGIVATR